MKNCDTKIYYKLYLLTKTLYSVVRNFPKEHKFVLGTDIIKLSWHCLDLAAAANAAPNHEKKRGIDHLSQVFDRLKIRLRMAQELRLVTIRQFAHLEENYLTEVGNMIGGWRKWAAD